MPRQIWCIQECRLFEQLSEAELKFLEQRSRVRNFPANATIYFPDDIADAVMVLVQGRIRLHSITPDGKQAILGLIEPGELFGELAIVGSASREEFAQSVSASRVVAIPKEIMESVLMQNASLSLAITKLVGLRQRRLERRLRYLLFRSNRERMIGLLCELMEQYGRRTDEGLLIDIKLSHQDLAGLIGVTRESVTLALGELQLERLITTGRRKIVVLNERSLILASGVTPATPGKNSNPPRTQAIEVPQLWQ